jgi:hypothetical protein
MKLKQVCMLTALSVASAVTYSETNTISAWVGTESSRVYFSPELIGSDYYISSESNCEFESIDLCENGKKYTITSDSIEVDRPFNGHHIIDTGLEVLNKDISGSSYSARYGHKVIDFQGRFWIIGGRTAIYSNDIYASRDGSSWRRVVYSTPFEGRSGHGVIEFGGKLWVIGGTAKSGIKADIWSSVDGINWELVTNEAPFGPKSAHNLVVHDNRLWLYAGVGDTGVWSSDDGSNWIKHSESSVFENLAQVNVLSNEEGMIAFGVTTESDQTQKIYSSLDGVNWSLESNGTNLPHAHYYSLYNYRDGYVAITTERNGSTSYQNQFWGSTNAVDWYPLNTSPEFYGRLSSGFVVRGNEMLLLGGHIGQINSDHYKNDVWQSFDGSDWVPVSKSTALPSQNRSTKVVVYNQKIFVFGGGGRVYTNNIYSSLDGLNWEPETLNAEYGERYSFEVVEFKGKLWLYAGVIAGSGFGADIWSSQDGKTWILEEENAAFGKRTDHRVVHWNQKLWLVGGRSDAGFRNDVWSSEDGINWVVETDAAPFDPRFNHELAVHDGKLWLSGGRDDYHIGHTFSDLWSTIDGRNWTLVNSSAAFGERAKHGFKSYDGKLWVLGGTYGRYNTDKLDIWSSLDGVGWTLEDGGKFCAYESVLFNDSLFAFAVRTNAKSLNEVWKTEDGKNWAYAYRQPFSVGDNVRHISSLIEGGNGDLSPGYMEPSAVEVQTGQRLDIEVVANRGYEVESVKGCNGELISDIYHTGLITENCTVEATFVPTYEVSAQSVGKGEISPEYVVVPEGTVVDFQLTPASWWYVIDSVSGCDGRLSGNAYTATINSDCSVIAEFKPWWR